MPVVFIDLAQQCAPQIAVETLAAVVSVESGFQPFAIRINSDHPLADQPRSRSEAIETATILIAEGLDIDLGLGGISSGDLGRLGISVADSFDFCLNLKASATLLTSYYQVALQDGATDAQAQTVMLRSYYGRGDASAGEMVGYDRQVAAAREKLAQRIASIEITEVAPTEASLAEKAGESKAAAGATPEPSSAPAQAAIPQWDVFNPGRRSSVLVFSNEHKE